MRSFLIEHLANFIFCIICVQNWDCFLVKSVLEVGHHEISILTSLALKFLPLCLRFETLLLLRTCTKMFTDLLISDLQSPRMSGWCRDSFTLNRSKFTKLCCVQILQYLGSFDTNYITQKSCVSNKQKFEIQLENVLEHFISWHGIFKILRRSVECAEVECSFFLPPQFYLNHLLVSTLFSCLWKETMRGDYILHLVIEL
jgi:hypothetical protein